MSSVEEITKLIEDQSRKANEFRAVQIARIDNVEKYLHEIEKKAGRPWTGGGSGGDRQLTAEQSEYRKAFDRYLRRGDDAGLADLQRKAMNTGSDPDGGYLVLPELDKEIDRVAGTVSGMFATARIVNCNTAVWEKMVKTAGMAMRRVAEGATGGESTEPKFAKVRVEVFPSEVEPWVHNETLEDATIDLEADLAYEAAIGFAEGGGQEFISGNGVGCARGILSYPAVANSAYAWGSVGYIVSGKSAAFASVAPADKIINLQHSLKAQYRKDAVFMMNDATLGVVRQIKDASGHYYLWNPDPLSGFGGSLLGSPVVIDSNMPDIAAGSFSIAFGNMQRGYAIVNRGGTTLIRDPYTSKGQTKFNFRRRFSGGITHFEAIKLMKFATS